MIPFNSSCYLSSLHFGDPDVIFLSPTDYNLSLADVPEIGFNRVPAFFTPNHHSRVSSNFESFERIPIFFYLFEQFKDDIKKSKKILSTRLFLNILGLKNIFEGWDGLNYLRSYSENYKTVEWEDDIKTMFKCIWWCYKARNFTNNLLSHL